MDALRGLLSLLVLAALLICTGAYATTVVVIVSEQTVNLTPVSQAAVYVDNSLVGKTDSMGWLEFSHPESGNMLNVRVAKRGFDDWTGILGANETSLPVELTRINLTFTAEVYDSDTLNPIPGASVILSAGGNLTTKTTDGNGSAVFSLKANEPFQLGISAENYQSRTDSLEMGIEPKSTQFWLYPDERFVVVIRSEERGNPVADAEIFFDGISIGKSDSRGAIAIDLPRDKVYMIKVRKEGYLDYNEKRIIGQDEAIVSILLEKVPYTIIVSVFNQDNSPISDAPVMIAGAIAGRTNQYGALKLQNMSYGVYNLSVGHPGYLTLSKDLNVTSQDEDLVIVLNYESVPIILTSQEKGGKAVPGALISLNGKVIGQTDSNGQLVTSIRTLTNQTVSATRDGYNPSALSILVNSSQNNNMVSIIMEPSLNLGLYLGIFLLIVIIIAGVILLTRRKTENRHSGKRGL
jgi:hypothetical protein